MNQLKQQRLEELLGYRIYIDSQSDQRWKQLGIDLLEWRLYK